MAFGLLVAKYHKCLKRIEKTVDAKMLKMLDPNIEIKNPEVLKELAKFVPRALQFDGPKGYRSACSPLYKGCNCLACCVRKPVSYFYKIPGMPYASFTLNLQTGVVRAHSKRICIIKYSEKEEDEDLQRFIEKVLKKNKCKFNKVDVEERIFIATITQDFAIMADNGQYVRIKNPKRIRVQIKHYL